MNRWIIMWAAVCVLILANLTTFLLMRSDKRRAQQGARRISERALFLSAATFGALGGVLGMYVFRHKTRHWRFKLGFPLLMLVQVALVAYGLWLLWGSR